jgi:hypothetical protein
MSNVIVRRSNLSLRVASLAAASLLVIGVLPSNPAVANGGPTPVDEIETAFDCANEGGTAVLSADIKDTGRALTVAENCEAVLDLNGKTLEIRNVVIDAGATLTIKDASGGDGELIATEAAAGNAGIRTTGATLVIESGTVTATGGQAAGIGGSGEGDGGTVTISGGTVTATGGQFAAGIGGSDEGDGGTVTISGGTVTATGGERAAGIGGGWDGAGGTVEISGGFVSALGGVGDFGGAGIGGGYEGDGGKVMISGGTVIATGGEWAAGIGGGEEGAGGTVAISGGTVTASGDDNGAGIGGGNNGDGGTVTISGGRVTATGGDRASGIGGGDGGNGGLMTISGGIVTASGGRFAAGIGGGDEGDGGTVTISDGTVTATGGEGGAGIGGGSDGGKGGTVTITGGSVIATGGDRGAGIGGGSGSGGKGGTVMITGGSVVATAGDADAKAIGAGAASSDDGTLTLGPRALPVFSVTADGFPVTSITFAPVVDTRTPAGTHSGPSFFAPGGVQPSQPTASAAFVRADGSPQELAVSAPGRDRVRYEADGIRVTLQGGPGTDVARGLVANPAGEIACEVCVTGLTAGQVVEVWLFSTPRLVAAHLTDDAECQLFTVPLSSPLDGGGPVSAGAHTLQFTVATSDGLEAVNVGLTVGGLVPTSVPAGEGPAMQLLLIVLGLVSFGLVAPVVLRRRVVTNA